MPHLFYECCDVTEKHPLPDKGEDLVAKCWLCGSPEYVWVVDLEYFNPLYKFLRSSFTKTWPDTERLLKESIECTVTTSNSETS